MLALLRIRDESQSPTVCSHISQASVTASHNSAVTFNSDVEHSPRLWAKLLADVYIFSPILIRALGPGHGTVALGHASHQHLHKQVASPL